MAKKQNKIKEIEVIGAKEVKPTPKESKKKYITCVDYGSNPDGTPRYPKGSPIMLTSEDAQYLKTLKRIE